MLKWLSINIELNKRLRLWQVQQLYRMAIENDSEVYFD